MKEFFWVAYEWYCYTFEERWMTTFEPLREDDKTYNPDDPFLKIIEIRKTFEETVEELDEYDLAFYQVLLNTRTYIQGQEVYMRRRLRLSRRGFFKRQRRFYSNFYTTYKKNNPELTLEIKKKILIQTQNLL